MRFGQYQTDSTNPVKRYYNVAHQRSMKMFAVLVTKKKNHVSETICPKIEYDPGKQRIYLGTLRKRRRLECLPVDCQKAAEPGRVRLFLKLFKLRITFLWGVTLLIRGWCISWSEMTSEAGSWNKITSKSLGYSAITFCLSRISNCSLGVFCNAAKVNQVCISYPASEYVSRYLSKLYALSKQEMKIKSSICSWIMQLSMLSEIVFRASLFLMF